MADLKRGLYEQLITRELEEQLLHLSNPLQAKREQLRPEEAADRISLHLGRLLRQAIAALGPQQRISASLELATQVIRLLEDMPATGVGIEDQPSPAGEVLLALVGRLPDGRDESIALPATPLLDTTLLTNAPGEPRIGFQLHSEIPSSDRIDVLMAFVRMTGIRPLKELLARHCAEGQTLRVLTTTYTGSTELSALEALKSLGAEVRISYDVSSTRLHAKAWLFHRSSGFSTAYIGSSNLTHSAQVSGLEWNVRVSGARNPDVVNKFEAVFESYWNNPDFKPFDRAEFLALSTSGDRTGPTIYLSSIEIRPEPFQSRLLEQIELSRIQGHHRNLLVAATGTGKTVMAALDYQRLRQRMPRSRLLFVAHRKEILEQSLATFRHALRDASFGELWVGGDRPSRFEHVFASVQSLAAADLNNIADSHFDVIVIDEFHHAAARTYDDVLSHFAPKELLGLTATPERSDGLPILHWFDDRIAAELRLWDAIDQQRLCPFSYFGISDGTDFTRVTWRRGMGYDRAELENVVTGNDVLARLIIKNTCELIDEPTKMRALGFCVSVGHARFMAAQFSAAGLPARAVSAETPADERAEGIRLLSSGALRVLFSVDLFNEGVDMPTVDTLLLLRPTDSSTLFLQQLGRGLRRSDGKTVCTVLDFVGQHRKEYQFQRRLGALIGGSRKQLIEQIEAGFPFLPSGCQMHLDAVAAKTILANIRESLPSTWNQKARELSRVAEHEKQISLKTFLSHSGLALEDIYTNNHSWSDLLEEGRLTTLPSGPYESQLRRALGRLLHIDDPRRIEFYRQLSLHDKPPLLSALKATERRLIHMLLSILTESVSVRGPDIDDAMSLVWEHPQVLSELGELMDVLAGRIDHVQSVLATHPDVPLLVHARYTRREILAAFAEGAQLALPPWREGVRWLPDAKCDLLAFTLDKTGGHFSPTTRYKDYAISPSLIHWESQSNTRAGSEAGRRYQQHKAAGSEALLFARLTTDDRAFWFLGPASYVSHEGERPMAIRWQLERPLPGDLFTRFAAAVS